MTLRLQQLAGQSESYAHKFSAEFAQQHPNVKTEIEEYPSADYWTKMLALHASDQLGDLAYGWNSQGHLASWAHKGWRGPWTTWCGRTSSTWPSSTPGPSRPTAGRASCGPCPPWATSAR